jgi:hypothetical protein
MGGDYGRVVFRHITVADNKLAGFEFERIELSGEDKMSACYAEDLFVVGRSTGNPGEAKHGIVAPQSDYLKVSNARFYNFDSSRGEAALGDCSHCDTPKHDSNTRTTRFEGLSFTNVDRRILWNWPFKGIFHDLDGSLTGSAGSYASPDWVHNRWPEC